MRLRMQRTRAHAPQLMATAMASKRANSAESTSSWLSGEKSLRKRSSIVSACCVFLVCAYDETACRSALSRLMPDAIIAAGGRSVASSGAAISVGKKAAKPSSCASPSSADSSASSA
eukprot:4030976-Prymnesium_polylepis.1